MYVIISGELEFFKNIIVETPDPNQSNSNREENKNQIIVNSPKVRNIRLNDKKMRQVSVKTPPYKSLLFRILQFYSIYIINQNNKIRIFFKNIYLLIFFLVLYKKIFKLGENQAFGYEEIINQ
jgi:hypothetical protein